MLKLIFACYQILYATYLQNNMIETEMHELTKVVKIQGLHWSSFAGHVKLP